MQQVIQEYVYIHSGGHCVEMTQSLNLGRISSTDSSYRYMHFTMNAFDIVVVVAMCFVVCWKFSA